MTIKDGDLVRIGKYGRKVYRVWQVFTTASGVRKIRVDPAGQDHPDGASRLPDYFRLYTDSELRKVQD